MQSQEVKIKPNVKVMLKSDAEQLDEVMVVAYGTAKKSSFTGAAASVDGANSWQQFWHITLPGLAPAIKINFVTSTISGLKVFDLVLSTTNGGPAHQTETILTLMYSKFSDGNFGYASAFGIVFLLMTMVVSAVMLGIFKKWEEYLN